MHQNCCWVVAMEANGIVKQFESNDVIVCTNYTFHINNEKNCFKNNLTSNQDLYENNYKEKTRSQNNKNRKKNISN